MRSIMRRFKFCPALLGACVLMIAPAALGYTIQCESKFNRYQYCGASTDGRVRLVERMSKNPCNQGRDWGYDGGGVWVVNGCRATFEVGRNNNGNSDAAKAAAIAGGLAILGAIVANSNQDTQRDNYVAGPEIPGWMIGRFTGYSNAWRRNEQLTIDPNGGAFLSFPGVQMSGAIEGQAAVFNGTSRALYPGNGGLVVDGSFYRRF